MSASKTGNVDIELSYLLRQEICKIDGLHKQEVAKKEARI